MADETVGLRNVCPSNLPYDLPEYGYEGVMPGDVIHVPATDADRFPETVWVRVSGTPAAKPANDGPRITEAESRKTTKAMKEAIK